MAANIWDNSDGDFDGNVAANWSLGNVPTGTDVMTFDSATTSDNCTFSGVVSCQGMAFANTYTGTVDFNDQAMTFGTDGLTCVNGGSATVDCGSSLIICSGNFNNIDIATWTRGTSTIKMTGTAKTLITSSAKDLHALEIDGSITSITSRCDVQGGLTINNGKSLTVEDDLRVIGGGVTNAGTLTLNSATALFGSNNLDNTGTLDGSSTLTLSFSTYTNSGTWSVANTVAQRNAILGGGTYGGTWLIELDNGTRTFTFGTGAAQTITFTGDVTFDADIALTYTIDAATNDVSIVFQGDVSLTETAGTLVWSKAATGDVTFAAASGTQVYTDSTGAIQDLGLVVHDDGAGTGTLQLATEMECTTFDGDDGSFDPNGQTLDCSGNVDWDTGWDFIGDADAMNGCTWTVGGNFTADAQTCNATAGWNLDVTGTAVASGVGDVEHSTAGVTEIDASAGPWTDSGNNTNWNFGAVGGQPTMRRWGGVPHMMPGPVLVGRSW